jgi:hypothetical protein
MILDKQADSVPSRRGYAEFGTENWYHAGAIRNMDRDGDSRVFRHLAMPQVSEQFRIELP